MTTIPEAEEALAQRFVDTWTPTGHEFTLENEKFSRPESEPWARFSVRINAATQDTLGGVGNRKFERSGSVFVQVFTPLDEGTNRSSQLVQTVVNGFEGTRIVGTTIRFNDVIPRKTGIDDKWFGQIVEATFDFDETK